MRVCRLRYVRLCRLRNNSTGDGVESTLNYAIKRHTVFPWPIGHDSTGMFASLCDH